MAWIRCLPFVAPVFQDRRLENLGTRDRLACYIALIAYSAATLSSKHIKLRAAAEVRLRSAAMRWSRLCRRSSHAQWARRDRCRRFHVVLAAHAGLCLWFLRQVAARLVPVHGWAGGSAAAAAALEPSAGEQLARLRPQLAGSMGAAWLDAGVSSWSVRTGCVASAAASPSNPSTRHTAAGSTKHPKRSP